MHGIRFPCSTKARAMASAEEEAATTCSTRSSSRRDTGSSPEAWRDGQRQDRQPGRRRADLHGRALRGVQGVPGRVLGDRGRRSGRGAQAGRRGVASPATPGRGAAVPVKDTGAQAYTGAEAAAAVTRAHHDEWARVVANLTRRLGDLDIAEEAAAEVPSPRPSSTGAGRGRAAQPRRLADHDCAPQGHRPASGARGQARRQAPGGSGCTSTTQRPAGRRYRGRPAAAGLHLLPPRPGDGEPGRADAAHARRPRPTSRSLRAFLVQETAVGRRITCAKAKIKAAGIAYRVPAAEDLPARVAAC